MPSKVHRILIMDGSIKSFSLLLGCIMQKRSIDAIVVGKKIMSSNKFTVLKGWLKTVHAEPMSYYESLSDALSCLKISPDHNIYQDSKIMNSGKNYYVTVRNANYKTEDLLKEWNWTSEVNEAVVRLSSTPRKLQQLILYS